AAERETALRRLAGVSLDGQRIIFMRGRDLAPIGPFPVDVNSMRQFFLYLRALARKPLVPDELVRDFGPGAPFAQEAVNTLFAKVVGPTNPKLEAMFGEWERVFGIVYGQELRRAEEDARLLAKLYNVDDPRIALKPLLFAVHTYFALFIKFLAAELATLNQGGYMASFLAPLPSLPDDELRRRLEELEAGGVFAALGIRNFLEGDFFTWYLALWDGDIEGLVRDLASLLGQYEPATPTLEPEGIRDLLKKLYQYLVPKKLRHDLGEYYTPDWLAELVLNQVGYDGDPRKRLLDPGCGSGTFLVQALKRARDYAEDRLLDPREAASQILRNVVGFDLNPLAVIAARTNYLLAMGDLARHVRPIEIPVYLCDSILTPSRYAESFPEGMKPPTDFYELRTTAGVFRIPIEFASRERMEALTRLLEECVRGGYAEEEFIARARRELAFVDGRTEGILAELYRRILSLEEEGKNGIWARIIKNAFAPIFAGQFDFVVGNPPWVNWESLSDEYREATRSLWVDYGLFSLKGWRARLGGGKKDLAMLFTYAACDNYLKDGGKLGFVITQTLFKTKGAGDGFRRFRLGEAEPLRVVHVDDLVELNPFEEAANRTAVFVCQKGRETKYPVPYTLWRRKKGARIGVDLALSEVRSLVKRANLYAQPVNEAEPTSPWITARRRAFKALKKVLGESEYQARVGACTWANGVYWVRIIEQRPDGFLVVENLHQIGRLETIKKITTFIEPDLLYPLLRGKDVSRWKARPSAYILQVQDPEKRKGYDEDWLKVHLPQTYRYLKQFEDILRDRSGFKKYFCQEEKDETGRRRLVPKAPFYSIYNVGLYTFAPYRVMWRQITDRMKASVVGSLDDVYLGHRLVIPNHKLLFVPCNVEKEAYFLCAILNSAVVEFLAKSVMLPTGYSTTFVEGIRIPKYDPATPLHQELAALSQRAHELAARDEKEKLREVEKEIDEKAAQLWGLTE
ncbi:MAG TPA: SAM-dependent DNA methyltransferase, partial [Anaerolineae bacterium]|nr:SAM-dependent DNA methyltransferase [Anaerolineae bacterium]